MKIEQQVISLEQARRLKELGVKQEGAVFYYDEEDGNNLQYNGTDNDIDSPDYGWSAFTVAELGMMLPEYIGDLFLEMYKDASNKTGEEWFLLRYCIESYVHCGFNMPTEAQSRAAMLIYLLENNLIAVNEINARI